MHLEIRQYGILIALKLAKLWNCEFLRDWISAIKEDDKWLSESR